MRKNQIKHYLLEIWKASVMILLIIALALSCAAQLRYYETNQIQKEAWEINKANSKEIEKMLQETKEKIHNLPEEDAVVTDK